MRVSVRLLLGTLLISGAVAAQAALLFDNGPLVTHPGGGAGGGDASRLQNSSLSMSTLGFTASSATVFRLADDFTVPAGGWTIADIDFFAYQTGSTTTSTFTAVNFRIWDGIPGAGGSSVVFGDTSTDRLLSTAWSGIYRDTETTIGNASRPIMQVTGDAGLFLSAGTYWVDWQLAGSLASGPFVPPITINGTSTTGNGLQFNGTSWSNVLDGSAQQGLPFKLNGTPGSVPEPGTLALLGLGLAGLAATRRRKQ